MYICFFIQKSISTCRFAQRVALIKNDALCNEELDPKVLIQKLKAEIASLKDELAMATGEQRTDALSEEDLERSVLSNYKRQIYYLGSKFTQWQYHSQGGLFETWLFLMNMITGKTTKDRYIKLI